MQFAHVIAGRDQIGGWGDGPKEGEKARFAEAHAEGGVVAASGHFPSGLVGEDLERSSSWKRESGQGELQGGGVVGEGARRWGSWVLIVDQ